MRVRVHRTAPPPPPPLFLQLSRELQLCGRPLAAQCLCEQLRVRQLPPGRRRGDYRHRRRDQNVRRARRLAAQHASCGSKRVWPLRFELFWHPAIFGYGRRHQAARRPLHSGAESHTCSHNTARGLAIRRLICTCQVGTIAQSLPFNSADWCRLARPSSARPRPSPTHARAVLVCVCVPSSTWQRPCGPRRRLHRQCRGHHRCGRLGRGPRDGAQGRLPRGASAPPALLPSVLPPSCTPPTPAHRQLKVPPPSCTRAWYGDRIRFLGSYHHGMLRRHAILPGFAGWQ